MEMFRTLDIRGLSFFKSLQLATEEFTRIKKNGILELIVDKKKNFTEDFSKWSKNQGFKKVGFQQIPGSDEPLNPYRSIPGFLEAGKHLEGLCLHIGDPLRQKPSCDP